MECVNDTVSKQMSLHIISMNMVNHASSFLDLSRDRGGRDIANSCLSPNYSPYRRDETQFSDP